MVVNDANQVNNVKDGTVLNKIKNSANNNNNNNNNKMRYKTPNNLQITHLKLLHQNICGLLHKTDELLESVARIAPHVLCLTEHHLQTDELNRIDFTQYVLGAKYCRRSYRQGGVSIFVSRD